MVYYTEHGTASMYSVHIMYIASHVVDRGWLIGMFMCYGIIGSVEHYIDKLSK